MWQTDVGTVQADWQTSNLLKEQNNNQLIMI